MDGYELGTAPNLGALLTVERAEGSVVSVFQIQHR